MSDTLIKICGLRSIEMAMTAVDAGADMIGLVFVEQSPRWVDIETARDIADAVSDAVVKVGLFVDADGEHILEVVDDVGLDAVQLHGHESPEVMEELSPINVIRALHAGDDPKPWKSAMALLYDTPQKPGALPGGSGVAFDWAALEHLDRASLPPLMLAGGLTPRNVAEAIRIVNPWAVDVSSGVESSRGIKDAALIEAFCKAVRG